MKNIGIIIGTLIMVANLAFAVGPASTSAPTTNQAADTFNTLYGEEIKALKPELYPSFVLKLASDTDNTVNDVPLAVLMLDKANDIFIKIKPSDDKNEIAVYLAKKYNFFGNKYLEDKKFKEGKYCFNIANGLLGYAKSPLQPSTIIYNKLADLLFVLNDKPEDNETMKKLFIVYLVELDNKEKALEYAKMSKYEIYNELINTIMKKPEELNKEQLKNVADFYKDQMATALDKSTCQINAVKYYELLIAEMDKDKKKDASYLIVKKNLENVRKTNNVFTIITEIKNMKASDKIEQIKKNEKKEEFNPVGTWSKNDGSMWEFKNNGTWKLTAKNLNMEGTWKIGTRGLVFIPNDKSWVSSTIVVVNNDTFKDDTGIFTRVK